MRADKKFTFPPCQPADVLGGRPSRCTRSLSARRVPVSRFANNPFRPDARTRTTYSLAGRPRATELGHAGLQVTPVSKPSANKTS
jgi:hypothetical protein